MNVKILGLSDPFRKEKDPIKFGGEAERTSPDCT